MQGVARALTFIWGDVAGDGNTAKEGTKSIHTVLTSPFGAAQEGSHPERSCAMQGWVGPAGLELGQSKLSLKCVQGGCQTCSNRGFALQACSCLSPAFARENTTSDVTGTPRCQFPLCPQLSPVQQTRRTHMGKPALQNTRVTHNKRK